MSNEIEQIDRELDKLNEESNVLNKALDILQDKKRELSYKKDALLGRPLLELKGATEEEAISEFVRSLV